MDLAILENEKFLQAVKLAETLAKSNIVPENFRGKGADVFATLVLGSELGFKPMQSLNSIVMIKGNATLKAQTMLAIVRAKCPSAIIEIKQDESRKYASCFAKRDDKDCGYLAEWDFDKAYKAGFAKAWDKEQKKWVTKDNWEKQPTTMARWRAISEALKIIFPDVIQGLYSTEEAQDIPEKEPIEMSSTELLDADFPIPPEEKECGPLYRIQNGIYRGRQLKDLTNFQISDYASELNSRKKMKPWEQQLYSVLTQYLVELKLNEVVVNDVKL